MGWTAGVDHSATVVTVAEWNQYLGTSGSLNYLKTGTDAPIRGSKNGGGLETAAQSINIVEGTGITATVAYNGGTSALDITLAASGGTVPTQGVTYYTTLASNTADDVEGAWTVIVASLGYDLLYCLVQQISGSNKSHKVDIGYGPGGSESEKVTELPFNLANVNLQQSFPFSIPSGSRVVARTKKSGTADSDQWQIGLAITLLG